MTQISRVVGDLVLSLPSNHKQDTQYQDREVVRESYGAELPDPREIKIVHDYGTRPKAGNVIFTLQHDNTCYQLIRLVDKWNSCLR